MALHIWFNTWKTKGSNASHWIFYFTYIFGLKTFWIFESTSCGFESSCGLSLLSWTIIWCIWTRLSNVFIDRQHIVDLESKGLISAPKCHHQPIQYLIRCILICMILRWNQVRLEHHVIMHNIWEKRESKVWETNFFSNYKVSIRILFLKFPFKSKHLQRRITFWTKPRF